MLQLVLQTTFVFACGAITTLVVGIFLLEHLNLFQFFGYERRSRQLKREDVISVNLKDKSALWWREQQTHNEHVKKRLEIIETDIDRVVAAIGTYQDIVMQRLISVALADSEQNDHNSSNSNKKLSSKNSAKSRGKVALPRMSSHTCSHHDAHDDTDHRTTTTATPTQYTMWLYCTPICSVASQFEQPNHLQFVRYVVSKTQIGHCHTIANRTLSRIVGILYRYAPLYCSRSQYADGRSSSCIDCATAANGRSGK
jgi:hypothetical protein